MLRVEEASIGRLNKTANREKQTITLLKITKVTQLRTHNSSTCGTLRNDTALSHQNRFTEKRRWEFRGNMHVCELNGRDARRGLKPHTPLAATSKGSTTHTSDCDIAISYITTKRTIRRGADSRSPIHDNRVKIENGKHTLDDRMRRHHEDTFLRPNKFILLIERGITITGVITIIAPTVRHKIRDVITIPPTHNIRHCSLKEKVSVSKPALSIVRVITITRATIVIAPVIRYKVRHIIATSSTHRHRRLSPLLALPRCMQGLFIPAHTSTNTRRASPYGGIETNFTLPSNTAAGQSSTLGALVYTIRPPT
jgi:hypothetical protein